MCKANTIGDATNPGYSKVGNTETSAYVNSARTIDDNRPKGAERKVDIIARKKQINANSKMYYAMKLSKN